MTFQLGTFYISLLYEAFHKKRNHFDRFQIFSEGAIEGENQIFYKKNVSTLSYDRFLTKKKSLSTYTRDRKMTLLYDKNK